MNARFGRALQRLHQVSSTHLADSAGAYVDRNGVVLAAELALMVDRDVERIDMASGMVDRAVTVTALHNLVQPLDRKGAFVVDGKTLHIDGIASDDGYMISFYVVP